jgi:hypothetical protein
MLRIFRKAGAKVLLFFDTASFFRINLLFRRENSGLTHLYSHPFILLWELIKKLNESSVELKNK